MTAGVSMSLELGWQEKTIIIILCISESSRDLQRKFQNIDITKNIYFQDQPFTI
jgi:hypothetical protein